MPEYKIQNNSVSTLINFEDDFLSESNFLFVKNKIYELAGIKLSDNKKNLVINRILKRQKVLEFESGNEYIENLKKLNNKDPEWEFFINILTTNKTFFFREMDHFEFLLNNVIPEFKFDKSKTLKIWCAASSTGEEPYSIQLFLDHYLPHKNYLLYASDIDSDCLETAKNAVYPISQLNEIPDKFKNKISKGTLEIDQWFKIKERNINFFQFNLISDLKSYNKIPENLDVIFCRNVFIYFNQNTIKEIALKMFTRLSEEGIFIISLTESLPKDFVEFNLIGNSIYQKNKLKIK